MASRISAPWSSLPSSTTMSSSSASDWDNTEHTARSIVSALLYSGITTLNLGGDAGGLWVMAEARQKDSDGPRRSGETLGFLPHSNGRSSGVVLF